MIFLDIFAYISSELNRFGRNLADGCRARKEWLCRIFGAIAPVTPTLSGLQGIVLFTSPLPIFTDITPHKHIGPNPRVRESYQKPNLEIFLLIGRISSKTAREPRQNNGRRQIKNHCEVISVSNDCVPSNQFLETMSNMAQYGTAINCI